MSKTCLTEAVATGICLSFVRRRCVVLCVVVLVVACSFACVLAYAADWGSAQSQPWVCARWLSEIPMSVLLLLLLLLLLPFESMML